MDAKITWDTVAGVDGYNVYLKSNGTFVKQNGSLITATEFTVEEIADGSYQTYVTSVLDSKESPESNIVVFQVPAATGGFEYSAESLLSLFNSARPLALETTDNLYVAALAKLTGTDSERGVLQYNKAGDSFIWNGLQEIDISDKHFSPTGFAATGTKVFMFGGWWGGSGSSSHQNSYVSYFESDVAEDISAFSAEKQLAFDDTVAYQVTATYPNFVRTAGSSMILCRLPQSSSNRDWGYRLTTEFPFEPADFDPTRILIDTDRWHYLETVIDPVDTHIVHFYTRDHSSTFKSDGRLHYFYMNFNTGKVIGKNGIVGDFTDGSGLPILQSEMWQVYSPVDWAIAEQPFGTGEPSAAKPLQIPFYNKTGSNSYEVGVATLDKAAGESGNSFTASLLGVTADNFIMGSAEHGGERFILINKDNQVKAIVSDDNFATHTLKTYGKNISDLKGYVEVAGGLSATTKILAHRGTLSTNDWSLTLIDIDLENFS